MVSEVPQCFASFVCLFAFGACVMVLTPCFVSGIIPIEVYQTIWGAGDHTKSRYVQDKHSVLSTLSLAQFCHVN